MPGPIIYILAAAGAAVVSYLVGHAAMLFGNDDDRDNPFAYAFRRLSLGAMLIVAIYALVNCAGVTILAGAIPLLLFGARFRMPRWRRIRLDPAAAALFCGVFVLMAALKYFAGHDLAGNIYSLHYDHAFYAALADYVAGSGIESTNLDPMHPALQSPLPYHWFDVHMTGLSGRITGNFYNARLFVAYPMSAAAAALGLAAVISKFCGRAGRLAPLLACLVLFIPYDFGAFAFHDNVMEKSFIVMCVISWALLSKNNILPLVVGGLLVSTAAPALFGGAGIMLLIRFRNERRSGEYWKQAAALALGALWCAAFYTLTAKENPYFFHFISLPEQIDMAFSGRALPLAGQYAALFIKKILLNFIPCVVLFALLGRDDRRRIAALVAKNGALLLAILVGLAFCCLLWYMRDRLQLVIEVSLPFAFVIQTMMLAMLFTDERKWRKAAAAATVAAGIATIWFFGNASFRGAPMDGDFIDKAAAIEGPVVWVDTDKRRDAIDEYVRDANYIAPFTVVRRLRNDYFPIRLDVYDIVYDPNDLRDYAVLASIENSTFYRWVESRKIPATKLRSAQTRFIKENDIHYVITPSGDNWIYGRGFRIEEEIGLQSRGYTLYRISYDHDTIQ